MPKKHLREMNKYNVGAEGGEVVNGKWFVSSQARLVRIWMPAKTSSDSGFPAIRYRNSSPSPGSRRTVSYTQRKALQVLCAYSKLTHCRLPIVIIMYFPWKTVFIVKTYWANHEKYQILRIGEPRFRKFIGASSFPNPIFNWENT